ncbi:MAG: NAD-dependent epimerase/dehydratase family protein [Cyanobacteria bacterium P01_A01_bin.84]
MKIGIIGATGMIGHHTANAVLKNGHQLVVIHRKSSNLSSIQDLNFTSSIGDLNDQKSLISALSNLDAVINCAAYYPTKPIPWKEEVKTAVSQMNNFYHACEAVNIGKIVYLGAAIALRKPKGFIALSKHPEELPATEEFLYPQRPQDKTPYLQVKWEMDKLAMEKAKVGLPVVTAIPSMCFGEFDSTPSTGRLIVEIANRTIPGYLRGKRNVIYTGDAGKGLVLACEKGKPGERYLFTNRNISTDDLVKIIAKIAQVPPPKLVIPLPIAKLVSKFQENRYNLLGGELPKLTSSAIAVMASGQFLDGSKARKELGFQPEVDIEEAISRAFNWFKVQGYIK